MYEYTISVPYKINNCLDCPMRRTESITEGIPSQGFVSLYGTTAIIRNASMCGLTHEPIHFPITVDLYDSKCPLKNKSKFVDDKEA